MDDTQQLMDRIPDKTHSPVPPVQAPLTPPTVERTTQISASLVAPEFEDKTPGATKPQKDTLKEHESLNEDTPGFPAPQDIPSTFVPGSSPPDILLPVVHDQRSEVDEKNINGQSTTPQTYSTFERPLNVTDALGYLDAVKVQFQEEPDVYNRFLDIMKDFKNELIDTPGVIQRVSILFNGHSTLIQGFNTFLPAGYRIECSNHAHETNFIRVTTPTGTTMQTALGGDEWRFSWSKDKASSSHAAEPHPRDEAPVNSPDPRPIPIDGQAIEPAVQYVQKIKQRCDPETYRQFLDILSHYHSQPDLIDEEEVSRRISLLFKDAPDLRSDFRIFMPERTRQNLDDSSFPDSAEFHTKTSTPPTDSKGKRKLENVVESSSALGQPSKRKKRAVDKEQAREHARVRPSSASSGSKKVRHTQDSATTFNQRESRPSSPRQVTQLPPTSRILPADEDSLFFDNVRRVLDNRETYNEFLKIVNLFTQDFIDSPRLIRESRNFLGDGELMKQFKNILGWNEQKERMAFEAERQAQFGWTRPVISGIINRPNQVELNMKYGSYRRLPPSARNVICSGRDTMCNEVLNDEWVSHASWANDDSAGFTAHRKNIFEEALHRSEEERHEYDFHIEAIIRTITLLEPINSKIAQLSPEEREAFKLKPHMGGSWKSIHSRVIKKLYGLQAGLDVIEAMQDNPSMAIPVVLQRLKQKEEEWKRAQREWNKVWREVDARNYMKSLDHQAIFFKTEDKKAITAKAFVSQIEAAREEQMAKRASLIDPLLARTRPRHQLEFIIDDVQVLQDMLKLTFSFLDRTQAQINFGERKRIEAFLRSFVPLFFMLDPVSFNSAFTVVHEMADSEMSDELGSNADDVEISTHNNSSRPSRNGGKRGGNMSSGGDLRKRLLKEQAKSTNRKTRASDSSPAISRFASPAPVDEDSRANSLRKLSRRSSYYTNTTFYVLLRLLEVLYSRLVLFKGIASKASPEATSPTSQDAQIAARVNASAATMRHYYDLLLESLERLFDNEIEQHVFEDQMRYMFGIKHAYKTFTIDKVIGAIIKQIQCILFDSKSQELLEVLKRERQLSSPTIQDQINSRRSTEKALSPDENLFCIIWVPDSRRMTVQLLGKDDSKFDDSEILTGRWQAYIENFVSNESASEHHPPKFKIPYLRRNLPRVVQEGPLNILTRVHLEIKICVRTYRLFYVSDTEDFLWKISTKEESEKTVENLEARNKLRRKWLEDEGGNWLMFSA